MKQHLFIAIFCLCATTALAQQQRIPDLSMSPDETLRQPDVSYSHGSAQPYNYGLTNDPVQERMNAMPSDDTANLGTTGFMTSYCDPNFRPFTANAPGLSGLQSCLESQKIQACSEFQSLPSDAVRVLNDTISCNYTASENTGYGAVAGDPGCTAGDTARLQLLKKYWGNQGIAHALIFMPDEVLNASGACIRGGSSASPTPLLLNQR